MGAGRRGIYTRAEIDAMSAAERSALVDEDPGADILAAVKEVLPELDHEDPAVKGPEKIDLADLK